MFAAALLVAGASHADDADDVEEAAFTANQYIGWTGITLYCPPSRVDKALSDAICTSVAAEFNFLTETAGVPHVVSRSDTYVQVMRDSLKLKNPLIFQVETTASGQANGTGLVGVNVALSARFFYGSAVNQTDKSTGPQTLPKGGDLVLWEQSIIGTTSGQQETTRNIAGVVNDDMKQWFATGFLKGWKASKH